MPRRARLAVPGIPWHIIQPNLRGLPHRLGVKMERGLTSGREELVETIYQATYQPDLWPQAMAKLTSLARSKSAGLFIQDKELRQTSGFFVHGVSKAVAAVYRRLGAQIDPGFKRMRDVPVGVARSIVDLAAPDEEIGVYEKVMMRPAGIHAILGVKLIDNEQVHAGIGIHRSREQGSFEQTTCSLVESVAPHFIRAITIYREFAKVNARQHAFHAGLERLAIGTVLFDHLARPIYMNPRARFLFENHPSVMLRGDLPIIINKALAQRVQESVIGAIEGDVGAATFGLFHPESVSPLVVRIVSVKGLGQVPLGFPGLARCVMYVTDPELSPSVSPGTLQQIYDLTTAESKVAVGLANGYSVEEICTMHNVREGTVRVQIRSIYQKVGVHRQSDLVRLILSIPVTCDDTGM